LAVIEKRNPGVKTRMFTIRISDEARNALDNYAYLRRKSLSLALEELILAATDTSKGSDARTSA
jgi:predicted transcriptional regulator